MASRVNVKFVVLLSTVLVVVAGGASALALMVLLKSAEDLVARGDALMAEGEHKAAELFYSKAVHKDPYNSEYLLKWRDSLHRWTPETDSEYKTEFRATYMILHRQLAISDNRTHSEYQLEHVQLLAKAIGFGGFDRGSYETLAAECDGYIQHLETTRPDDPNLPKLRRERGLAWTRIASQQFELTPEQMTRAEADLTSALEADPADIDALEAMIILRSSAAERARQLGRRTEATDLENGARQLIDSFIAANGADTVPGAQALILKTRDTLIEQRSAAAARLGSAVLPELERIAEAHRAQTQQIADTLLEADPQALSARVVSRLQSLESMTDASGAMDASLRLADRALGAHPADPELILAKARLLAGRGEHDGAISTLETLIRAPRRTIGIEGMSEIVYKTFAAVDHTDYAIDAAMAAGADEQARTAWIQRAKASREQLTQMISESAPKVQFFDAKLALLEGDAYTAQQKIDQFNQAMNNKDTEGLWLAADIANRLNQLGNAQIALERLIELEPTQSAPHIALATVLVQLNRLEAARDHYLIAQKARPEDQRLLEQIRAVEIQLGMRKSDDPIEAVIIDAQLLATGSERQIPDVAAAVEVLRQGLNKHGPHRRLYAYMARLLLNQSNHDAAAQIIEEGLRHFPDDPELKQYNLAATGSLEDRIAFIQQSDRPELEKQLSMFSIYAAAGRTEDAERALEAAERLDPSNSLVIEVQFNRAFEARDLEKARRLADRAKAADLDRLGGLSYRARVLMLEGREADALAALGEVVRRSPNNASHWRALAGMQLEVGRALDAIQSFQRALEIRPQDLGIINQYCRALIMLNRPNEALELARRSEVYGRNSPEFMEILLGLEASVGNKQGARDRRERILQIRPDDVVNRLGLGNLYVSLGQWDQARALIDETRAKFGESLPLTELDARWHAERNDLESARRVFAAAIARAHPDARLPIYTGLAQFMIRRGHTAPGIVALEQAARHQAGGDHSIDTVLGDALMQAGRQGEALAVYRRILTDGDDEDFSITKRAVEAAVRVDRLSEAERLLATIPNAEADVTAVLLRSDIVLARGDGRSARAMLDSAVEKWPDDYRVWLKRAEAEALTDDLLPDALADVEHAAKLRPDIADTHRQRASLLIRLGRHDEAIEALRETVRLRPNLEELRYSLLLILVERGRETEALSLANEWFALRPRDVNLRSRVAETFVQVGKPALAISIYQEAMAIEQQPEMVLRLAELLLQADPPRLADAERVLNGARTVVAASPPLLMARAAVLARTSRMEAANNDSIAAYRLIGRDAESMDRWYGLLVAAYPDAQSLLTFLRLFGQQPDAAEWAALFTSRVLLQQPQTAAQGLAQLEALIPQTRNPQVRYAALRRLSGHRYGTGDFEGALDIWRQVLELRPEDWMVENNIAYTLAIDLNRPEDALPYATSASKHSPNSAEAHDTLGAVYLALDRPAEAIAPLEAAVSAARTPDAGARYRVRLALARLESGDRTGAEDLVSQVQGWLDRGGQLDDQYGALLERVRQGLQE